MATLRRLGASLWASSSEKPCAAASLASTVASPMSSPRKKYASKSSFADAGCAFLSLAWRMSVWAAVVSNVLRTLEKSSFRRNEWNVTSAVAPVWLGQTTSETTSMESVF